MSGCLELERIAEVSESCRAGLTFDRQRTRRSHAGRPRLPADGASGCDHGREFEGITDSGHAPGICRETEPILGRA